MLRKIKTYVIALMLPLALAVPLAVPSAVSAGDVGNCPSGIEGSINQGINAATSNGTACQSSGTGEAGSLQDIASTVVNFLSVIVGIIAVIMIIVGGFRYITSGGDSGNVSSAKNTLIYAIVGLIIVALAQFIVNFVLANIGA